MTYRIIQGDVKEVMLSMADLVTIDRSNGPVGWEKSNDV